MKKLLTMTLMVAVLSTGISKESKAFIGLAGGGSISSSGENIGTGLWLMLGGPIAGMVITGMSIKEKEKTSNVVALVFATIFAPISGLVLLDGEGNTKLKELDSETISSIQANLSNADKLKNEEILAYNSNVDVFTGVAQDLAETTRDMNDEAKNAKAEETKKELKDQLGEKETDLGLSALHKIVLSRVNK